MKKLEASWILPGHKPEPALAIILRDSHVETEEHWLHSIASVSQSCVHFRWKRALSVSSLKDKLLHSIYHQYNSNSIHQSILNLYTAPCLCIPFVLANPVFVFLQVLLEGLAVETKSGDDRYNGTENLARLLDVWQRFKLYLVTKHLDCKKSERWCIHQEDEKRNIQPLQSGRFLPFK